jgi:lysophospholipase L1-like esterase
MTRPIESIPARRNLIDAWFRFGMWTAVGTLVVSTLALVLAPRFFSEPLYGNVVSVSDVRPDTGLAYIGKLSDPTSSDEHGPSPVLLYAIHARRGGFLHHVDGWLGQTLTLRWLKAVYEARLPTATYHVRVPLGPAHSLRDDVRQQGNGRYSVWQGYVYFSLPPGVSIANVARMEALIPIGPRLGGKRAQAALRTTAIISATVLAIYFLGRLLAPLYHRVALVRNVAPGLIITAVLLVMHFAGMEIYLRASGFFTKDQSTWVSMFFPEVGFLFKPGAEIRQTDGIEFATVQRANSLGFLDGEPAIPKPAGTFRVLIVGDSMIEAVQVPLKGKVQTVLADLLRGQYPQLRTDVVGMGYSGTGQANQLAWYRYYKDKIQPDLIVLVFTANDFSNNSVALESIRQGWHPEHPPWMLLQKQVDGSCRTIAPSANATTRKVPGGTDAERLSYFRNLSPEYREQFVGWDASKIHLDWVFYETTRLPPAFEEAIDLTRCAFALWKKETDQDGVPLVVMAVQHVTGYGIVQNPPKTGQIDRIRSILADLKIPLLDLYQATANKGHWLDAQLKYDGHWSLQGHRWAAEAILEYMIKGGYLDRPRTDRVEAR